MLLSSLHRLLMKSDVYLGDYFHGFALYQGRFVAPLLHGSQRRLD